jgi:protein-S-isoprenylcysteine O-methyltransferase Ste14
MRHAIEAILATIVVPGAAVVLAPYLILSAQGPLPEPRLDLVGLIAGLLGAAGVVLMVWVSYAFVARGKGTPIPIDPPRKFVADGFFRYVRNPMYLGALLVVFAETILLQSSWLLAYAFGLWLVHSSGAVRGTAAALTIRPAPPEYCADPSDPAPTREVPPS